MTQQPPTAGPAGNRFGLIRPAQGRYVAGVCAALGNATRTDPVLWRVVLAVLLCFGGIGAFIYLMLWIFTPEEGDTASPVQALFGRGHSSTSPVLVAVLALAGGLLLVYILPRPMHLVLLGAAAVLVVLLLTNRVPPGAPVPGPGGPPGTPAAGTTPVGAPGTATAPTGSSTAGAEAAHPAPGTGAAAPADADHTPTVDLTTGPVGPGTGTDGPDVGADGPDAATRPEPANDSPSDSQPAETGAAAWSPPSEPWSPPPEPTRPYPTRPFAPHGPFAPAGPPPAPPRPPRERSVLPALTLFAILIVLGLMALVDLLTPVDIPAPGYVAAALTATGAGLLVGAWVGRARPLIALGLVLTLALPVAHAVEAWDPPRQPTATNITWQPTTVEQIDDRYAVSYGEGVLDLREVDFNGERVEVAVSVYAGEIRVLVPPEVTVDARTDVVVGAASVPGREAGGLVTNESLSLPAATEPAAGELSLELQVRFGSIKVMR